MAWHDRDMAGAGDGVQPGGTDEAMNGSTEHRGVGYSITDLGNGNWRWKLHPKKKAQGAMVEVTPITSGEISGTRDEAVAAAKRAIEDGAH